jgi:hypothetical protein
VFLTSINKSLLANLTTCESESMYRTVVGKMGDSFTIYAIFGPFRLSITSISAFRNTALVCRYRANADFRQIFGTLVCRSVKTARGNEIRVTICGYPVSVFDNCLCARRLSFACGKYDLCVGYRLFRQRWTDDF